MAHIEDLDIDALAARGQVLQLTQSLFASLREWSTTTASTSRPSAPERAWGSFSEQSGSYITHGAGSHFDHIKPTLDSGLKGTKVYQKLSSFKFLGNMKETVRERKDSSDSDKTIKFQALEVDNSQVVPREDWDSWECLVTAARQISSALRYFEKDAVIFSPPHPSDYPRLPYFPPPLALAVPISPKTRESTPTWLDFYVYLVKLLKSLDVVWEGLRFKAMAQVEEATRLRQHLARKEIRRDIYSHKKAVSGDLHWDWEGKTPQTMEAIPLDGPDGPYTPADVSQYRSQDTGKGPKVSSMSGRVFCNRKPNLYQAGQLESWRDDVGNAKRQGSIRRKEERRSKIVATDDLEHIVKGLETIESKLKREGSTNSRYTSTLPRTAKATLQERAPYRQEGSDRVAPNTIDFPTIRVQPTSEGSSSQRSRSPVSHSPTSPPKPKTRKERPLSHIDLPEPKRRRSSVDFGTDAAFSPSPISPTLHSRRPRGTRPPVRRRSSIVPTLSPTSTFFGGQTVQDVDMTSEQHLAPPSSPPKLRVKPVELTEPRTCSEIQYFDDFMTASVSGMGNISTPRTYTTLLADHVGEIVPPTPLHNSWMDYPTIPSGGSCVSARSTRSSPLDYSGDRTFTTGPLAPKVPQTTGFHTPPAGTARFLYGVYIMGQGRDAVATASSDPLFAHLEEYSSHSSSSGRSKGGCSEESGDYESARSSLSIAPLLPLSAPRTNLTSSPGSVTRSHRKTLSSETATYIQQLTPGATLLDEFDGPESPLTPKAPKPMNLNTEQENSYLFTTQTANHTVDNDEHGDDDKETYRNEDFVVGYYTEQKPIHTRASSSKYQQPRSTSSNGPQYGSTHASGLVSQDGSTSSTRSSPLIKGAQNIPTESRYHRIKVEDCDSVVSEKSAWLCDSCAPKSGNVQYRPRTRQAAKEAYGRCHCHVSEHYREERRSDVEYETRQRSYTTVTKTHRSRKHGEPRSREGEPFNVKISAVLDRHGEVRVEKVRTRWAKHTRV